jgi:hypothetical protein
MLHLTRCCGINAIVWHVGVLAAGRPWSAGAVRGRSQLDFVVLVRGFTAVAAALPVTTNACVSVQDAIKCFFKPAARLLGYTLIQAPAGGGWMSGPSENLRGCQFGSARF